MIKSTPRETYEEFLKDYLLEKKLQEVVRLYFAGCTLSEAMKLVRGK